MVHTIERELPGACSTQASRVSCNVKQGCTSDTANQNAVKSAEAHVTAGMTGCKCEYESTHLQNGP